MKLYEYQGAELFKKYKIAVPNFLVIAQISDLQKNKTKKLLKKIINKNIKKEVMVKAQVLTGKRGKHGGVQIANEKKLYSVCNVLFYTKINGLPVQKLIIAEKEQVQEEWYLAITINRFLKQYTLLFSKSGGVDIEELSEKDPGKIEQHSFFDLKDKDLAQFIKKIKIQDKNASKFQKNMQKEKIKKIQLKEIIKKLFLLMQKEDATLVEINPLLLTTKNKLIAADSKVIIDDNALYRHAFSEQHENKTKLELQAAKKALAYVELDGNIAVIGNGAGLVMASLDMLSYFGGKPASFLDLGGGTGEQAMNNALHLTLQKKIKGLFINIFAGITHCDEIAQGIVAYKKKYGLNIPVVVRMIGTNEIQAKGMLEKENIHILHSMESAAQKIVSVVK